MAGKLRPWACLLVAGFLGGAVSAAHADMVYLTMTGPETGTSGIYNATLSYDTAATATSPDVYPAVLTFDAASSTPEPETATITITPSTTDPDGNAASEIEIDASGIDLFESFDTVNIFAPPGTFTSTLPTLADWQNLISTGPYSASANGMVGFPVPPFGFFPIFSYQAPALTLSVSASAPTAVPSPAAIEGALPLLGLCGLLKLRRSKK